MKPKQFWQLLKENHKQINTLIQITILVIAILAYFKVQQINVELNQVKGRLADFDQLITSNLSMKFGNKTFTALTTNGSGICMPDC